jgi:hypothetical protein
VLTIQCGCYGRVWSCTPPSNPTCGEDLLEDVTVPPDVEVGPDVYVPPTGCPPAADLFQGLACSVDGEECPGNPTFCDGALFYDALQCNGSFWVTLAATQCGDAGPADDGRVGSD